MMSGDFTAFSGSPSSFSSSFTKTNTALLAKNRGTPRRRKQPRTEEEEEQKRAEAKAKARERKRKWRQNPENVKKEREAKKSRVAAKRNQELTGQYVNHLSHHLPQRQQHTSSQHSQHLQQHLHHQHLTKHDSLSQNHLTSLRPPRASSEQSVTSKSVNDLRGTELDLLKEKKSMDDDYTHPSSQRGFYNSTFFPQYPPPLTPIDHPPYLMPHPSLFHTETAQSFRNIAEEAAAAAAAAAAAVEAAASIALHTPMPPMDLDGPRGSMDYAYGDDMGGGMVGGRPSSGSRGHYTALGMGGYSGMAVHEQRSLVGGFGHFGQMGALSMGGHMGMASSPHFLLQINEDEGDKHGLALRQGPNS